MNPRRFHLLLNALKPSSETRQQGKTSLAQYMTGGGIKIGHP